MKNSTKKYFSLVVTSLLVILSPCTFAQGVHAADHIHSNTATPVVKKKQMVFTSAYNSLSVPAETWSLYCEKANALINTIDAESILNYVILSNDGNLKDRKKYLDYVNVKLEKDKEIIAYKIGTGSITRASELIAYLHALQPAYSAEYVKFKKNKEENIAKQLRAPGGPLPVPFNCGSPCTNPGFEAGTGFWDYWTGTACTAGDPCGLVAGLSGTEHSIQTAGAYDAIVGGTILPVVPPGGGTNSLRLGNTAIGGQAARASMSFTVSAANANFTYRYAVVLEDPTTGHTDPERPYFRVKIRDAGGNVVTCGDYEVICKPPLVDFTRVGTTNYYYRNWTTVFVPLSSYIGQCITVEFTSSDCAQTGHLGYAYVDADCDPLEVLTSSPAVCGGNNVTLTAPSGGVTYSWSNTAGGTTGIVGSTTNQTCVVNQGGTYQVVITSVSGPTCTTTLNLTVGSSPANPVASFTNTTVCAQATTVFTDTSTPSGSVTAWSWDFDADGIADATTANPSHVFPASGTYPVTLIVTMGPCNATVTQNVTVNPGVGPAITAAGPFCVNAAPVTLNGIPAGGTWAGSGITNTATGDFDPAAAAIGNNNITYSIGGACPGTANSVIIVNPLPISNAGTDVVICSGVAASIGTPTTAGHTYSWSPATGLSNAAVSDPAITTVNAGAVPDVTTYTVTTTQNSCSTTDAVQVTVNPVPVLSITNPPAVCVPNTVDITAAAVTAGSTGGGTLTYWTDAAGTIPLAGPTGISTSGTYYIKVTAAGGCTDIDPVLVTINPLPVSNAGADITICSGTPASIGVAAVAGNNYAWLPATGLSAANVSNPNITTVNGGAAPIVTTYTVTTSVALTGCSTTDDVVVTVDPLPVLNITNPPAVCSPNMVDITLPAVTAGSTGGGTLTYWTDAAATVPLSAPTAITTSGTYYIKVTAVGGCTDLEPVVVIINPLPVSNAGTDVTICSGTAASIGSPATAGYNYSWLPATGLSAANVADPSIITVNGGTTPIVTTYSVTTTVAATGCTTTDDVLVTVNPQPVLTITNPAAVCSPNTVDITGAAVTAGSTGGGILSYWTDAAATTALSAPTAVTASGTYYIKVTATGGCTDIDPVVVTINPLPASEAGPNVTICTGTPASIGSAATAGNNYSWLPAAGLSAVNVSNPSITTTNGGTAPIVTTYTVTTTIAATGCQTVDSVIVTVNPFPVLSTTDPAAVCAPGTIDITNPAIVAGTVGSGTYAYWLDAAGTVMLPSPAAVAASGTYYIQLVSGAGCSDMDSVVVTINPLPVSDAGPDLTICTGSAGPIGAAAVAGYNYLWAPATGLSGTAAANPIVTLTNITLSPVSTTYTVTTTNSVTGCQTVDSVVVTVDPVATANAGSSQSVCAGTSLTMAGAVGGAASGGTWSGGAGTFSPGNTALNAVYTPTAAEYASGSVTLTLTSDDPAGPCAFASSSVTFYFYQNPVVDFSVDDPSGCPVHCGQFTDLSTIVAGDTIVSWNWSFGDGSPDSTSQNPSHCYSATGFYNVELTVTSNHGCVSDSTQVQMVQVFAIPVAEFTAMPNPASVLDPEVTLLNGSSSDVIYWTYYFGDGDSITPFVSSPVHLYPSGGPATYNATLMVENSDGCRDTVEHPVVIGPEFTFFIPNAFTPNGDGVNDDFFGQGIGIIEYDIWIFDRWGNMIYHGDDINSSKWDGKANKGAEVAQQDVYVWKVKLTDVFDKKHNYIGTVTLVK